MNRARQRLGVTTRGVVGGIRPDECTGDHPTAPARPLPAPIERLTLRLGELAAALGVGRRLLERERAAGRVPPQTCTSAGSPFGE
jgi:hypothetical protein